MDYHEVSFGYRSRFGHVCNHFTTAVRCTGARSPWYSFHQHIHTHGTAILFTAMVVILFPSIYVHVRVDRNATFLLNTSGFYLVETETQLDSVFCFHDINIPLIDDTLHNMLECVFGRRGSFSFKKIVSFLPTIPAYRDHPCTC